MMNRPSARPELAGSWLRTIVPIAVAAALAVACSDEPGEESTPANDTLVFNVPDAGPNFTGDDVVEADVADSNQQVDDADAAADTGPIKCDDPGGWGCPCKGNADCNSGYCVETAEGKQCSKLCVEDCPGDWQCVGVKGSTGDLTFICAAPYVTLCRPCAKDGDCEQLGAEIGVHRCIPIDGPDGSLVGSFCGYGCANGGNCPTGFSCTKLSIGGSTIEQCRPDNGTCSCSKQATAGGFATKCTTKNAFGTCGGQRTCTDKGLSACDAPVPATEVCDGKDNDCDGETDEGYIHNDFGVTKPIGKPCGAGACAGGEVVCAKDGKAAICSTGGGNVELCDGADNDCDGATDEANELDPKAAKCFDKGVCAAGGAKATCIKGSWSCDYAGVKLYEATTEVSCDGKDNDCDGSTDEDFTVGAGGKKLPVGAACGGIGICKKGIVECKDGVAGVAVCSTGAGGSNDGSKGERCNDLDDDCDGEVDEGCDDDGDGFCDVLMKMEGAPKICGQGGGDCDDNNKFVNPGATELCDNIDNDCKAGIDDGCDVDGDGHCSDKMTIVGNPSVCKKLGFDCNDKDKAIHPGAKEVCDGIDNDCNGQVDAADLKLKDVAPKCGNQKGVCAGSLRPASKCNNGKWLACDTAAYFAHHGAYENAQSEKSCDGADNNCDGKIDEGCDDDGDGHCDAAKDTKGDPKICPKGGGDCNDKDAKVHPDAVELCNGKDDDCNKLVDASDPKLAAKRPPCENQKGVCKGALKPVSLCKKGKWKACTDTEYSKHSPFHELGLSDQTCDDIDNNCNGKIDEGCDVDGDGSCGKLKKVKGTPKVCPKGGGDCNDNNKAVNPHAPEVCDKAFVDENCNGKVGEAGAKGCTSYYYDGDSDGYGSKGSTPICLCQPDAVKKLTALKSDDCNDGNFNVNPGAKETCATAGDDNCNNKAQELGAAGCKIYWYDPDFDGFGSVTHPPRCQCYPDAQTKYTATKPGDCDDGKGNIGPNKTETCATPFDDNCDGSDNDINAIGCTKFYVDADKDGYGKKGSNAVCMCKPIVASNFTAKNNKDCNDGNKNVKPGVKDTCKTPGVDDNCDGKTDPENSTGCKKLYYDGDGDGWGVGAARCFCNSLPQLKFTATKAGDCDDKVKTRRPGAPELCNGIDDDCDKVADEGASNSCKKVSGAGVICSGGKCKVNTCGFGWFDVDGSYANGCECRADAYYLAKKGNSCKSAVAIATVPDNGTVRYVGGNIMLGESGDWYRVHAQDLTDSGSSRCDRFNFTAKLTSNPGSQFRLDMYRGTCSGSGLHCAGQTTAGWTTRFYGLPYGPHHKTGTVRGLHRKSPNPPRAGECKCTTSNASGQSGPGLPGLNMCSNNSATFYIRVYRKPGAKATCQNYTLAVSNGK